MAIVNSPLRLTGVIQEYAWGGIDFIAELIGHSKSDNTPWAELWLGAHPRGAAATREGRLDTLIAAGPAEVLSQTIAQSYDNVLPFLFKVLDVHQMLSIQAHPTKEAAKTGFAREEAMGIDRTAPYRNYRDRNHKPELGVALTDFYLLHGFKSQAEIKAAIQAESAWTELLPILEERGLAALYQTVMKAEQAQVNAWLQPLADRLVGQDGLQRNEADFWAKRAFEQYSEAGNHDRGIFSVYWFNLVHLRPGQGIFQKAGVPHAYLEGCCIELMANSDNVLRGGLTPKHIDVPELMLQLDFSPVRPTIIEKQKGADGWQLYPVPVADFSLAYAQLEAEESTAIPEGPAILLVLEGEVKIDELLLKRGEALWLPYGHQCQIDTKMNSQLYLARTSI